MDLLLSLANAIACGLISLALIGAILSPKVHDGIVVKIGLISMAAGFFTSAALLLVDAQGKAHSLERALLLINAGIAVVLIGYLMRKVREQHPVRRATDWADLDNQESAK